MTLAVQPEQTELIAMADRAGALRVSLRPVHDSRIVPSDGVTSRDITGGRVTEDTTTVTNEPRQTPVFINLQPTTTPSPRRGGMTIIRGVQEQAGSP